MQSGTDPLGKGIFEQQGAAPGFEEDVEGLEVDGDAPHAPAHSFQGRGLHRAALHYELPVRLGQRLWPHHIGIHHLYIHCSQHVVAGLQYYVTVSVSRYKQQHPTIDLCSVLGNRQTSLHKPKTGQNAVWELQLIGQTVAPLAILVQNSPA